MCFPLSRQELFERRPDRGHGRHGRSGHVQRLLRHQCYMVFDISFDLCVQCLYCPFCNPRFDLFLLVVFFSVFSHLTISTESKGPRYTDIYIPSRSHFCCMSSPVARERVSTLHTHILCCVTLHTHSRSLKCNTLHTETHSHSHISSAICVGTLDRVSFLLRGRRTSRTSHLTYCIWHTIFPSNRACVTCEREKEIYYTMPCT